MNTISETNRNKNCTSSSSQKKKNKFNFVYIKKRSNIFLNSKVKNKNKKVYERKTIKSYEKVNPLSSNEYNLDYVPNNIKKEKVDYNPLNTDIQYYKKSKYARQLLPNFKPLINKHCFYKKFYDFYLIIPIHRKHYLTKKYIQEKN